MKKKRLISIVMLKIMLNIFISSLLASEESAWEFTVGAKGTYSSGISDSNTDFRLFGDVEYSVYIFRISSEISRYFNYQITDGMGTYDYIGFNELGLAVGTGPADWISLNLEYRHSSGDLEYNRNSYIVEIIYDYKAISIIGDYNRTDTDYAFNSLDVKQKSDSCSLEVDYFFSDSISFDAGLSFNNDNFQNIGYDYYKITFRMGSMVFFQNGLNILFGLSFGKDSEEYRIAGIDSGLSWKINENIKLLALYSFQYYIAQSEAVEIITIDNYDTTGNGHGNNSHSSSLKKDNPFLSISKRGESYSSHIVNFGISYNY
ncbi:MAG: hypothetical protein SVR08_18785 [Spirochaetota bacterium]|nr:hypothetical protein [Spirochaetota bacterium]